MINMGIEFILKTSDIKDVDKIAYISEHEAGPNFGRVIVSDIEIVSSILNNIFICCSDRNWALLQEMNERLKEDIFALPPCIHRVNIRNRIGTRRWQRITDESRKNADYTCENCKTNMKDDIAHLHSHEDWLLDYDNKTELIGIRVLCEMCHMYFHQGLYGVNRLENKIDDEKDKIVQLHWKTYPQKGYNIIISDINRKIMGEIFNSNSWTIKPFYDSINNIMKDIGQKTQDNAWD